VINCVKESHQQVACYLLYSACEGHLTVVPQNTAVISGSELTLHCDTNTTTKLSWYFGRRQVKIFNGFEISQHLPRHSIRPPYDLLIGDVSLSDAGIYTCLHSKSHSANAEVVVLGKK